jgi:hypothetical protein
MLNAKLDSNNFCSLKKYTPKLVCLVFIISTFSACSTLKEYAYRDYGVAPLKPSDSSLSEIKEELKSTFLECNSDNKCKQSELPNNKPQRNAATAGLIIVSDELCQEHVRSIFGNEAAYNLTFGTLTNLFAGAATVAASKGAKTLFSSIALFSNAERSLVNETVYKTMLVTTVTKKIKEGRTEKRIAILQRMRNDDIEQYTLNESISDVMDYHNTCSFMYGLERALEEGTENGAVRKKLVLQREVQNLVNEYDVRTKLLTIKGSNGATDTPPDPNDPQLSALKVRIDLLNKQINNLGATEAKDDASKADTNSDTKVSE